MESERVNFMTSRSLTCLPVSQHLDGPPVVQGTFAPERTWVRIILFLLVTKQTDHVTRMTNSRWRPSWIIGDRRNIPSGYIDNAEYRGMSAFIGIRF